MQAWSSCPIVPSLNPKQDARAIRFILAGYSDEDLNQQNRASSSSSSSSSSVGYKESSSDELLSSSGAELLEIQWSKISPTETILQTSLGSEISNNLTSMPVMNHFEKIPSYYEPLRILFVLSMNSKIAPAAENSKSFTIPQTILLVPDGVLGPLHQRATSNNIMVYDKVSCRLVNESLLNIQIKGGSVILILARSLWETVGYASVLSSLQEPSFSKETVSAWATKEQRYLTKESEECNGNHTKSRRKHLSCILKDSLNPSRRKDNGMNINGLIQSLSQNQQPSNQRSIIATCDTQSVVNDSISKSDLSAEPSLPLSSLTSEDCDPTALSTIKQSSPTQVNFISLESNFIKETPHYIPTSNDLQSVTINSKSGIPIETDLFVGNVMLLLRPPNTSPRENVSNDSNNKNNLSMPLENSSPLYIPEIFFKKKRNVQVQFQGKFKRKPTGVLYCGGEITENMKLGLVTKGLCNMLLKLLAKFNSGLHYSFGDDQEYAHIVFPAWTFFDRIVVSKQGDDVPQIGQEFEESEESQQLRKNCDPRFFKGEWNTTDTFSMSFHSMYLDLATWHLTNLPIARDMDLSMFWGESMLRLIMYEVPLNNRKSKGHMKKDLLYYVGVQVKFIRTEEQNHPKHDGVNVIANAHNDDNDVVPWKKARPSMRRITSYSELSFKNDFDDDVNTFPELSLDSLEGEVEDEEDQIENDASDSENTLYFDADQHIDLTSRLSFHKCETLQLEKYVKVDQICPGWIFYWKGNSKSKPNRKYSAYFAIVIAENNVQFRDWKYFQNYVKPAQIFIPSRVSNLEKRRRLLGSMISDDELLISQLSSEKASECEKKFLRRNPDSFIHPSVRAVSIAWDFIARAKCERHWVEECVVLSSSYVSFYQPGQRFPLYRIIIKSIVRVSALDDRKQVPTFPGFHFMSIAILGKTTYLMFSNIDRRDKFIHSLSNLLSPETSKESTPQLDDVDLHLSLDDPAEEFLHNSSLWKCRQRKILNSQDLVFYFPSNLNGTIHPCDFIKRILLFALDLKNNMTSDNMLSFLHQVAQVKGINVHQLAEKEKLAFFLNLYHVMVLHAFYILGPPPTSVVRWANYFNLAAYQCSDDVFSIAELEHCIIRTSSPSHFSKFVLPKSRYPFALSQSDFRINFALNCGSCSNPEFIIVYHPSQIDEQLNMATKLHLQYSVKLLLNEKRCLMLLPRVCHWFSSDFGDPIANLPQFFSKDDQQVLQKYDGNVKIKSQQYDFRCRQLLLLQS